MVKYRWGEVMNIFLLEDDDAIGIGLTYSLKNEGYGVTLAKTVGEDPSVIGYQWDGSNPKIQLEPIGTRGYIELLPIKEQ